MGGERIDPSEAGDPMSWRRAFVTAAAIVGLPLLLLGMFFVWVFVGAYWGYSTSTDPPVPTKPIVHRPAAVGIVQVANGHSALMEDGTTLYYSGEALGPDDLESGCILFTGDEGHPWYAAWCSARQNTGSPRSWKASHGEYAWDEGTAFLFENGLELPKATDFRTYCEAVDHGGDLIYPPDQGLAHFSANERGEVTSCDVEFRG
jgi:hypothetical protein